MAEINKLEAVEVKWYEKNCNWSDRSFLYNKSVDIEK